MEELTRSWEWGWNLVVSVCVEGIAGGWCGLGADRQETWKGWKGLVSHHGATKGRALSWGYFEKLCLVVMENRLERPRRRLGW